MDAVREAGRGGVQVRDRGDANLDVELGEFFVQAFAGDAKGGGSFGFVTAVIAEGFGDEPGDV